MLDNDNIIIRPTDKGLGIVEINKDGYIEQLEKEMDMIESYEKVDNDETASSIKAVKRL